MAKLVWDASGNRFYETGIEHGTLYKIDATGAYPLGVAWNGLTGVEENPSGAEATKIWADNINYITMYSAEQYAATIKAYTYPEEFEECDGSASISTGVVIGQQDRKTFGLAYKTKVGNDVDGDAHGYKIHLLYGAKASPSAKSHSTINDSPEAIEFSWEVSATPVNVTNYKATCTLEVDSRKFSDVTGKAKLKALEDVLFGVEAPEFDSSKTYNVGDIVTHTESSVAKIYRCTTAISTPGAWNASDWTEITNPGPRLPLPDEVLTIIA